MTKVAQADAKVKKLKKLQFTMITTLLNKDVSVEILQK